MRPHFSDHRSLNKALRDTQTSRAHNAKQGHSAPIDTNFALIKQNKMERIRLYLTIRNVANEKLKIGEIECHRDKFTEVTRFNQFQTSENICVCLCCAVQRFYDSKSIRICCGCGTEEG